MNERPIGALDLGFHSDFGFLVSGFDLSARCFTPSMPGLKCHAPGTPQRGVAATKSSDALQPCFGNDGLMNSCAGLVSGREEIAGMGGWLPPYPRSEDKDRCADKRDLSGA